MLPGTTKSITEFKKDFEFGGTGGGRLRQPCRDCKHYDARSQECRHPVSQRFTVVKEIAPYKGCKKGWEAK